MKRNLHGRFLMKRIIVLIAVLIALTGLIGAAEPFFGQLSDVQRYDLADAYNKVADRFEELDQHKRSEEFRSMVRVIFPGFGEIQRPAEEAKPIVSSRPEKTAPDPAGADASYYYFNKLLRGVFNENLSLTISVMSETLYLPLFDSGLSRKEVTDEVGRLFNEYDLFSIAPADVFYMDGIETTPLDNGYWRLDVETRPGYENALPEVTFWSQKMGFYFRNFPEGWRLAAIGPVY